MFEKIREPRIAAPERMFDKEATLKRVIELRSDGHSTTEIGTLLDMPDRTVRQWLAEAAAEFRRENMARHQEIFAVHQYRTEALYQLIRKELLTRFSTDLVKCALLVLERQAKLLALDRAGVARRDQNDWLESASSEDLIAEARKLGIPVPEKFDAPTAEG